MKWLGQSVGMVGKGFNSLMTDGDFHTTKGGTQKLCKKFTIVKTYVYS
jgi:hypothetical protein